MPRLPRVIVLILAGIAATAFRVEGSVPVPHAQADADLSQVSPPLAERSVREVTLCVARRQLRPIKPGEWKRGSEEECLRSAPPSGTAWNYPWGVTLYGLLRTAEVTGDKKSARFVLDHNEILAKQYDYLLWQQQTIGKTANRGGIPPFNCLDNTGSMASEMTEGLLKHGAKADTEMLKLLGDLADYIHTKQSRLPDGTFCRCGKGGRTTVWVDDLYMSCPFLARWGTYTKDRRYWDDAAREVISFASRLQDKDGLWFHGWFEDRQRTSPYKWGRGNGWAIVTEVEVLSQLPEDHPDRPKLLEILRKHIEGLKQAQAPSGMWRQVVDHPESWEETSCTAMFAYAIARACNCGWVSKENLPMAQKAFEALKARVSSDGSVSGICVGTGISTSLQAYLTRPRAVNDHHGIGPVLLAGAELMAAGCR